MYLKSHKELIVWQKSIRLVKEIFLITEQFPKSEYYGLVAQMRRAAISIPSNIAEGYGRRSTKDFARFCSIAYASSLELETQFILAKELEFISTEKSVTVEQLLVEVLKMLNAISSKMKDRH